MSCVNIDLDVRPRTDNLSEPLSLPKVQSWQDQFSDWAQVIPAVFSAPPPVPPRSKKLIAALECLLVCIAGGGGLW